MTIQNCIVAIILLGTIGYVLHLICHGWYIHSVMMSEPELIQKPMNTVLFDMNYVTQHVQALPTQSFDPQNTDHQVAFALLYFYKRQHPTLRFNFDAKHFDNAYQDMMHRMLEFSLGQTVRSLAQEIHTDSIQTRKRVPLKDSS